MNSLLSAPLLETPPKPRPDASVMTEQQQPLEHCSHHQRDPSFCVTFSPDEVLRLAKEVYDETVAEVTLSLFIFWVCEKEDHYEAAKLHVRELGLDQGYQTCRIENKCLRKLLDETIGMRPRQPYFATNPTTRGTPTPRTSTTPTVSSEKFTPRSDSLPSSFRGEIAPWSNLSPGRDSPPNTPDRPAPLTIRSRCSSAMPQTPAPNTALLRSVSTPIRPRLGARSSTLPTKVMEATAVLASMSMELQDVDGSFSVCSTDSEITEDHQYGVPQRTTSLRSVILGTEDEIQALLEQETAENDTDSQSMSEQDAKTEVASIADTDATAATETMFDRQTRPLSKAASDPFNSPPEYASVSRQNPRSRLSEPLTSSQPHYSLQNRHSGLYAFNTGPAPTPAERRAAAQARRLARATDSDSATSSISSLYRPLPFRTLTDAYSPFIPGSPQQTSEQTPFRRYDIPASNATSSSRLDYDLGVHRCNINAFIPRNYRYPVRSATQPSPARSGNSRRIEGVDELALRVEPNVLRYRDASSSSLISRGKSLQIPADTVNRAVHGVRNVDAQFEVTPTAQTTRQGSLETVPIGLVAEAYNSITSAYMTACLQRTRARGAQLRTIQRIELTVDEIAWRASHDRLLLSIYGRTDALITDIEKQHVENIAKQLQGREVNDIARRLFIGLE